MSIDLPKTLAEVPIEIKTDKNDSLIYIDHINLFRVSGKGPISEFAELANVLSRLSAEGRAEIISNTVLVWKFRTSDISHVLFVVEQYAQTAIWYRINYKGKSG